MAAGRRSSRRSWAPTAVVALVALVAGAAFLLTRESEARATLEDFVGAWQAGRYAAAAELTGGEAREVQRDLLRNRDGLDGAALEAEVLEFEEQGDRAVGSVRMRWRVPVVGSFAYTTEVPLVRADDAWAVGWSPAVVHPALGPGQRLGTTREFPERAPILDRTGRALVQQRPVVDVGVVPRRVEDTGAVVAALEAHVGAEPRALRRALREADSDQFVPGITLRQEEFDEVRDVLEPVPGIVFAGRTMPLAPTREFARALLGTVGPVTAEQLEELGPPYGITDQVGQWGLQAAFERELAGTPDAAVVIRGRDGTPVRTLQEKEGRPGTPLPTTLDRHVQQAAEAALGKRQGAAALVAIEPATGNLLAVANRPVEETFNRGLEGQYPPGSTFKVVTTAALLDSGLDAAETVPCPSTITVGGRAFRNFEGNAHGSVPFRTDFAQSCNTAFVSLSDRLDRGSLPRVAQQFGLARDFELPLAIFTGAVPQPRDEAEQAEAMIGQGRVLASPLAMAAVAATAAAGRWRQPRLVSDDPERSGPPLDDAIAETLRSLMRDVVEYGTGTAASGAGGVAGKTGTAEFGAEDPPKTHAWFIGFRNDVAAAVLVENAPSGGTVAAPIAGDFFTQIAPPG